MVFKSGMLVDMFPEYPYFARVQLDFRECIQYAGCQDGFPGGNARECLHCNDDLPIRQGIGDFDS